MGWRVLLSIRSNCSTEMLVSHLVVVGVRNRDGVTEPSCHDMTWETISQLRCPR